ncbi:MAG TPA: protein kinase [Steroidobacteraceae bacterium]|nr:protein kinase [Steroidobacteraceae bacterium]
MSATREDALTVVHGPPLAFDASPPAGPDPTSDIADEVTSELGGNALAAPTAAAAPGPATVGSVLRDRYVLETRLGAGGTAVVHRAVDLRRDANALDGRHVAIKLLRTELRDRPHAIERLQREFRQSLAAAHPNVVRVFDLDCDRGAWFIVMELLSGEPLGALLRRPPQPGLPPREALRLAGLAADGLAQAHAVGVVHGDVKPDNLFLTDAGDLRILDFGSAPDPGAAAAPSAGAVTRAYASPERLAGAEPAPADDVFSLACVTYEMLAGVHPFARLPADEAAAAGRLPGRIPALDEERFAAFARALSFERAARPAMAEFAAALRREPLAEPHVAVPVLPRPADPAPHPAVPPMVAPRPAQGRSSRGRKPWLMGLAAVAAFVLVLLVGILIGRQRASVPVASPPVVPAAVTRQAEAPATETQAAAAEARVSLPPPEDEVLPPAPVEAVPGPPGIVFFDAPRMTVSRDAVVAPIPMRNLSKVRRAATVNWRIVEGTARGDRDFGGPLEGSETFIEGNSFRILYVPILQPPRARGERRFVVEMTGTSAGTTLGPTPSVEVTILGDP